MLPSGNKAIFDGEQIVGIASSTSCSSKSEQNVQLSRTDSVSESVGVEMSKTKEMNWGVRL